MTAPKQAVVFCGGLGTRLKPLTDTMPKPMAPIEGGKPFLHYLLEQLSSQGISRFVLLTGYMADVISEYFGDGSQWGWRIDYSQGPVEWDTGRRLWEARALLDPQFLLLYSDNFAAFRLDNAIARHNDSGTKITLLLKEKENANVSVDPDGKLLAYDKSRKGANLKYVELGYMIVEKPDVIAAYGEMPGAPDISFSDILSNMVGKGQVYGTVLETPYYSISDMARLELMRKHLSLQKIVLLDRDGTLHRRAPRGEYHVDWDEGLVLPSAIEGLKNLSQKGYRFIVISNQAGIGRGVLSRDAVDRFNRSLKNYFASLNIDLMDFYICPHHWEDDCSCRKPKPGLFFQCATDYDLRLGRVLYIGDDPRDIIAAKAAGTDCLYVGDADELAVSGIKGQRIYSGIDECVGDIVRFYGAGILQDSGTQ